MASAVGFLASSGKYVSQDSFGNLINCSGATFKAKQTFTLVQGDEGKVYIQTPKKTFFSAGEKGKLVGDASSQGKDESFEIVIQAEGTWAFRSAHGYYLSIGSGDEMNCFARDVGPSEKFSIQFAMHPQVCMFSPARKAYAHLEENQLRANEVVAWGYDSMITLEFHRDRAKYTIRASNGKFWTCNANFADEITDDALYAIQMAESKFAFKGSNGKYLSAPTANRSKMTCTGTKIGNSELWDLSDSNGQFTICGNNKKYLSVSKGDDPSCCREEIGDTEIFELNMKGKYKCVITTHKGRFLSVSSGSVSSGDNCTDDSIFDIEHHDNFVAFKCGGKYFNMKPNGGMVCNTTSIVDTAKFSLNLVNRQQLVIRSEHGFVTTKRAKNVAACNASEPEIFTMESNEGLIKIKAASGYWAAAGDGNVAAAGSEGDDFIFEYCDHSKLGIKHARSGLYLQGSAQGPFKASAKECGGAGTLWEY